MLALMSRQAIKRAARTNAGQASREWESPFQLSDRRKDVMVVCGIQGIEYPVSKWGVWPEMLRTQSPEWWGRKIKKADRREVERLELKTGRITRYCSDLILGARVAQKKANRELLEQMVAICDDPDGARREVALIDLVRGSIANPAVRRAELMTRISGFERYAASLGHVAFFYTFTCPSRFHRNSAERWDGSSPTTAAQYLGKVWARVRAALKRAEIEPYGFRIAEPHKDACPHWHCLFWYATEAEAMQAGAILRKYFLKDSPTEPGAQKRRVTIEKIDSSKGTATGYIAKYICKNVDGIYDDQGDETRFNDQRRDQDTGEMKDTGLASDEAAARVDAWAACWGIRQFQQIGGPKVGAWRELRRLKDDVQADMTTEVMRAVVNEGQWDLFCALDDKHRATHGQRVRVWSETSADKLIALAAATEGGMQAAHDKAVKACLNQWQEPALRTVKGLLVAGRTIKTRFLKWVLMLKAAADAIQKKQAEREMTVGFLARIEAAKKPIPSEWGDFDFQGANAPPWSSVNNCTRGKKCESTEL